MKVIQLEFSYAGEMVSNISLQAERGTRYERSSDLDPESDGIV